MWCRSSVGLCRHWRGNDVDRRLQPGSGGLFSSASPWYRVPRHDADVSDGRRKGTGMISPRLQNRITTILLFCLACGLGTYLINVFAERGPYSFFLTIGSIFLLVWVFTAGSRWWLVLPVAVTFGGFFFFGFKIYLHEAALPICLLTLLPAVAMRRVGVIPHREPLSVFAWGLLAAFVIQWGVGLFMLKSQGAGGVGSMSRVYFHGVWPVLFLVFFYHYGDCRHLRAALALMYGACVLRVIIAGFAFFMEDILHLPLLNFIFSGSLGGIADFRYSGLQLLLLGLCFAQISRSRIYRAVNLIVVAVAGGLILLGGGRVSVGMLFTIPLFWALLLRRFGVFTVVSCFLLITVGVLNQQPQLIYQFPPSAQRALSVLVRDSPVAGLDWHEALRGSNEWHRRLAEIGYERWMGSASAFLFGERAMPFDESYEAMAASLETKAQIAARMGLYESGLWTVLGITGLFGLVMYVGLFWFLLRDPARALWREGLTSLPHVIGAIAVTECVLWCVFSWIAGGFPSQELLMATLAKVAYDDSLAANKEQGKADLVVTGGRLREGSD